MSSSQTEFREIYNQYIGLLQFYLRKLSVPDDKTDDIIQDTFLRFFNNQAKVEKEKIKNYLLITARNLVIDSYRKETRRKTDSLGDDIQTATDGMWHSDPQRDMEVQMLGNIIDDVAKTKGAECFRMFYKDGLTLQEIADQLNEPIGTIASRVSRLRTKFRDQIKQKLSQVGENMI